MRLSRSLTTYSVLIAACQPLIGCNDAPIDDAGTKAGIAEQAVIGDVGDPTCVPNGTRYTAGALLYTEQTNSWGLAGVNGSRLSVADINGDNYPDLIVRTQRHEWVNVYASTERSSFNVRVLKNNRRGGFVDVTRSSGLLLGRSATGGEARNNGRPSQVFAFADVDNDGDLDAFAGGEPVRGPRSTALERSELLLNDGYGIFHAYNAYPFSEAALFPAGATFIDQNRDGLIDLMLPSKVQRSVGANNWAGWLFRGAAAVPLADVAPQLGLTAQARFGQASAACDVNEDGAVDLLISGRERAPNAYWQAVGTTGFVERGQQSAYAVDGLADWKDNLFAQAYCSFLRTGRVPVALYATRDDCVTLPSGCPATCTTYPCQVTWPASASDDAAACQGVPEYPSTLGSEAKFRDALQWDHKNDRTPERLGGDTFATLCADFDGDSRLDLLNSEVRERFDGQSADPMCVLRNARAGDGSVVFSRPALAAADLSENYGPKDIAGGHAAEAFDMDNDGRMDLYAGSVNATAVSPIHQNTTSGNEIRFQRVNALDAFALGMSEGAAVADFDRDGDLDLVVGTSSRNAATGAFEDGAIHFYRNELGSRGNWVQLKLIGQGGSNRSAIGARVTVTLLDGTRLVQEVDGGHGHFGAQNDHVLHFGLGANCRANVEVSWPDATRTKQNFAVDTRHRYRVVQGAAPGELPIRGYCSNGVNAMMNSVGPNLANDYYDVFCVQDRLAELGYRGRFVQLAANPDTPIRRPTTMVQVAKRIPQELNVNGRWSADIEYAIRTFRAAISGPGADHDADNASTVARLGTTYDWLNATNAPRWLKLPPNGTNWVNEDTDSHDWGTNWLLDIVNAAGAAAANDAALADFSADERRILTNDVSLPCGGDTTDHSGHEGGLNLDTRAVRGGYQAWYNLATFNDHLNRYNANGTWNDQSFWSRPLPPNTPPPADYCPWPANAAAEFRFDASDADPRFEGTEYNSTTAKHADPAILYLWGFRTNPNSGCFRRIADNAPGAVVYDTAHFDAGFDVVVGTKADYTETVGERPSFRTRAAHWMVAFAAQANVSSVIYNDPIARRDAAAHLNAVQVAKLRHVTIHSDHIHIDRSVPNREAPTP